MNWGWKKKVLKKASALIVSAVLLSLLALGSTEGASMEGAPADSTNMQSLNSSNPEVSLVQRKSLAMNNWHSASDFSGANSVSEAAYGKGTVSNATYGESPDANVVKAVKELIDKRTRTSRTYLNSDGTTTVQSAVSINYFDGHVWQDIDTTIRPDHSDPNYTHSMLADNFKVRLNDRGKNES